MKKSTDAKRLPNSPERTIFKQYKNGDYHHTVTMADLLNVTGVMTGRFGITEPNFSGKSKNKPKNVS